MKDFIVINEKDNVGVRLTATDKIFDGVTWFHFTGITPALSDECAAITLEACKKAKEKDMTISCDLNFRKKLWSKEKAGEVMSNVCRYVDYCMPAKNKTNRGLAVCF